MALSQVAFERQDHEGHAIYGQTSDPMLRSRAKVDAPGNTLR